jgi:hypothetical protein
MQESEGDMSREKIEEMVKILIDYTKKNHIIASHVILADYAEQLYNEGYRKQSEGDWIKCEEMELTSKCSICKGFHTKLSILQYDLRYCPNCGAKMKGGAE